MIVISQISDVIVNENAPYKHNEFEHNFTHYVVS